MENFCEVLIIEVCTIQMKAIGAVWFSIFCRNLIFCSSSNQNLTLGVVNNYDRLLHSTKKPSKTELLRVSKFTFTMSAKYTALIAPIT